MASNLLTTIPADNVKASKAEARAQYLIIKTEIEELQRKVRLPWKIARGDIGIS